MLSPPSAKKLSSIPTRSTPKTSANSPHSNSSCGVRGKRPTPARTSGAGNAPRSSFPASVSPSAKTNQQKRSLPEPCSPEDKNPDRPANPPHQLTHQPPLPHSRQAAASQRLPCAQPPPPAKRSRAQPAPPQSPQAQCGNREP